MRPFWPAMWHRRAGSALISRTMSCMPRPYFWQFVQNNDSPGIAAIKGSNEKRWYKLEFTLFFHITQSENRKHSMGRYSPNCSEDMPPQLRIKLPKSGWPGTSNFISGVLGEWSDTTKFMSPFCTACHSRSWLALSRIGGQHLKSTRFRGTASAFRPK